MTEFNVLEAAMWFQCLLFQMSLELLPKRYFMSKQELQRLTSPSTCDLQAHQQP